MRKILTLFAGLFFVSFVFLPTGQLAAQFDATDTLCSGRTDTPVCNELSEDPDSGNPSNTIASVVNILSIATSIIAVIIMVVAGLTMTLSAGDANKVKSSKETIIYAAIGLVIVAISRSIIIYVINF